MTDHSISPDTTEALASVLMRCRTVLANMADENEGAIFKRWPINHEPLRADAKNLVPLIDEALAAHHTAFLKTFNDYHDHHPLDAAATLPKPPTPLNDADMNLATDWYTWGFQAGLKALSRSGDPAQPVAAPPQGFDTYRETVKQVAAARERRLAELTEENAKLRGDSK